MNINCPICGDVLVKNIYSRERINSSIEQINYHCNNNDPPYPGCCNHYDVWYHNDVLISKFVVIIINEVNYYFWSEKEHPFTKIGIIYDGKMYEDIIYETKECFLDLDEIQFTKKILKMKAFL